MSAINASKLMDPIVFQWRRFYSFITGIISSFVLAILASGPVPKHVAFVMDGNRRYAKQLHQHVTEGQTAGFGAFEHILEICQKLKIKNVSVYAWSIENFKRPKEQVDAHMEMSKVKLVELASKGELLDKYGVRLNMIGRKDLLPPDVREMAIQVEEMTKDNTNSILNICMPYTSQDEMLTATNICVSSSDCSTDMCSMKDTSVADFDSQMEIARRGSEPLDILVRTGGTYRLSDYMLWQGCDDCQIHYCPKYWPEFGLWDFLPMILAYQKKHLGRTFTGSDDPKSEKLKSSWSTVSC